MKVLRLEGGAADLTQMAKHFGGSSARLGEISGSFSSRERRVTFDNSLVTGTASSISIGPGFHLAVSDLKGHQALRLPIEHSPTELEFSFCRSPGVSAWGPMGEELTPAPDHFQICSMRERTRLTLDSEAGAIERSVRLNLSVEALQDLLGGTTLPAPVDEMLGEDGIYSSRSFLLDARISSTLDELLEASGSRSTGRSLFVHGKTMELLALASESLETPQEARENLPVEQVRRLHHAKEILLARLENPPSVQALAQKVHMGERQLKTGFKALFGAPVMTYARRARMERAQTLLANRRHNVTEVAHLLGYANPSKFAAAFRRHHGISPSAA